MIKSCLLYSLLLGAALSSVQSAEKPNIIFIFADDMGIGDVSHNGGKAPTPAIDRMAKGGLRFTDAHTTSSVCTPSRYGLLTGRYNWRTRLQASVFFDPLCKPLIKKEESTVASLLKEQGYHTACVGKWHLGFDWALKEGYKTPENAKKQGLEIDFTKPSGTPRLNGFDYYFGILASLDMPPYVFIENDKATEIPTLSQGYIDWFQGLVPAKDAVKRIGITGEGFTAQRCLPAFAEKSVEFINQVAKDEKPFFLYLPLTSPHTPITPNEQWLGKSGIGHYGDFVMETDWVVGQVLEALDKNGIAENTLVIFSTDNGCSPAAKIPDLHAQGHFPNGNLRGHKADIYEGGHRVPTLAIWPKVIKAGTETARLTTLADFYATCADITSAQITPEAGVDSVSFLPTLKGEAEERDAIVMHSINGAFAIRKGDWKLCLTGGSGGWSLPKKAATGDPKWQLFNIAEDISEKSNLFNEHPEKVEALHTLLIKYVEDGRSTPGPAVDNDVVVKLPKK